MNRILLGAAAMVVLVACSSGGERPVARTSSRGPAEIQDAAVGRHAQQFNQELGDRPAGSQEEFAAATYITGHLQQAGYVVRLEAVPVGDLVRSSNVEALAPSGDPQVVVTVAYDTLVEGRGGEGGGGGAIGAFLELARALRVSVPDHGVEFVALGAERSSADGGALGSRRLIRVLEDADLRPEVIQILSGDRGFSVRGAAAAPICRPLEDESVSGYVACERGLDATVDPFDAAGFVRTLVSGQPETVAGVLLRYLEERSR